MPGPTTLASGWAGRLLHLESLFLCLWVQGATLVEFFEKVAAMMENSKRTVATLEAHYQFLLRLLPTVEKFPRSHKFTLGERIEIPPSTCSKR
jgi:hypothetical protein